MNRIFVRFSTLLSLLLALSVAYGQPKTLTILHTNDMHASFTPHEAFWIKTAPKPMLGGFKELFFAVDSIRKVHQATLLLDAGDVMTGNPITEQQYRGAFGGALFEMMNMIGYDAWCPGNHDFDISQQNLAGLASIAKFPTVCANLLPEKGLASLGAKPYVILSSGGLRVGIIGLISQELYSLVNQNNLVSIKVLSPAETAQKYIDELLPKTDLLIALTHQGADMDSAMALQVKNLDIIVGGQSHTRLKHPKLVNGVVIVQTGSNCENLGELTVTVDNHHVTHFDGHLNQLWVRAGHPSNGLTAMVDSLQAVIDRNYSEVIGTLGDEWVRHNGPTGMGTFITEAQREAAGAEVGFMNDYGMRKDLPAGPMTKRDLFEILPFRNTLVTFELSGHQLRDILHYYAERHPAIQITGLSAEWKKSAGGSIEITAAQVLGKPLDDGRMYKCAASDYFVGEAKHYLGLEITKPIFLNRTMFEVVEKAVRTAKVIRNSIPYQLKEVR